MSVLKYYCGRCRKMTDQYLGYIGGSSKQSLLCLNCGRRKTVEGEILEEGR